MGVEQRKDFKLKHSKIDTIVKAMDCAKRNSKNIMLSGPIGTGKTTLCSQIADKLGLDFYPFALCSHTTKSDLIGFIDAGGNYRSTAIREAYEKGGLVLLDEMDASNPNVLGIINNILANGQYYFPDGIVEKHQDFKCICAMNSNGRGSEIIYTKSQRLDASTLDRFIFIKIDIDPDLEKALTDNEDWYNRVLKFREVVEEVSKDEIVIGSRAMLDGADLLDAGFSQSEVEDMVIYKGIDEDMVETIKAKMGYQSEHDREYQSDSSNGYTLEDGLYVMKDDEGNIGCWIDMDYAKADNFQLMDIIKQELGLH